MDVEAKKGEKARETLPPTLENYRKLIEVHQERALDYIRRKADDDKPFYLAYWPNMYDLNRIGQEKFDTSNGSAFAQNVTRLDRHVGEILDELKNLKYTFGTYYSIKRNYW